MLYLFDKDNTLVSGMNNRPANKPDEQSPLPNVIKKIKALINEGHQCFIVSNQGGVSFGYMTDEQARDLMKDACQKCGIPEYNFLYCPYMAGGKYSEQYKHLELDRKPNPGMLLAAMKLMDSKPKDTIMVGDQDSDKEAAHLAHVKFVHASKFFE